MDIRSQYLRMTREQANTFANTTSSFDDPDTMLMEPASGALELDPKVFWCVNGFIFVMFSAMMCWCCFADKTWLLRDRRQETDLEYQRSLAERQRKRELAKVDSPEERTRKLLQSFKRHKVQMTVREQDLIDEDPSHVLGRDDDVVDVDVVDDDDVEASQCSLENSGQLKLGNEKLALNCCAICLTGYDVGDEVVWSSNQQCQHAFHQDCILGWLVKIQPETPCPCCRQEFTDLEQMREEHKVIWSGAAFDWHRIGI